MVIAILVISISSDSLDKSVGSSPSQIILFGTIQAEIPAKTPTIPFVVPTLLHISLFLYTDSSDSDTSKRPPSQDLYKILTAPFGLPRRPAVLVLPGQPIPLGRPYHTQPNRVRKMLTANDSSSDSSSDLSDYSSYSSSGYSLPDSSIDTSATISARPSQSYEAYMKPGIDSNVQIDINVDIAAAEAVATREAYIGVEGRRILAASEHRVGMLDRIGVLERDNIRTMPTATRTRMTPAAIKEMIKQRVVEALEAYEANRNRQPMMESGYEREDDDRDGIGNGNGDGGNGNRNPAMNRIVGTNAVYAMPWKTLMKLMTKVYCPRNEIQKIETEL
nr:hypothetical protein [Tanacetum cinerariifolium]GEX98855.1 hypothetical protein [Tanacetum cinerariifolium]